jgi:ubiquitin carboxyl-terminal hydrolase 14
MNKHPACFSSAGSSLTVDFDQRSSVECSDITLLNTVKISAVAIAHNKILLYVCRSLVDQYFGGTFDCELKCTEAEDEPPSFSKENFLQLSCFISQDMRYMLSGLRSVSIHN